MTPDATGKRAPTGANALAVEHYVPGLQLEALQQALHHSLQVGDGGCHGGLPAAAAVAGVVVPHHVHPQLLAQLPARIGKVENNQRHILLL